jgi:hypothetical protein
MTKRSNLYTAAIVIRNNKNIFGRQLRKIKILSAQSEIQQ